MRSALEASGLDHGPISVHDKMNALGFEAPAIASLARIFRQENVARAAPNKRPRSAYRRSDYPAQYLVADGCDRIRAHRRAQMRDLPAAG